MTDTPAKPISLVDVFDQADAICRKITAIELAATGALLHENGVEPGVKVEALEALCNEARNELSRLVTMIGLREHKPAPDAQEPAP